MRDTLTLHFQPEYINRCRRSKGGGVLPEPGRDGRYMPETRPWGSKGPANPRQPQLEPGASSQAIHGLLIHNQEEGSTEAVNSPNRGRPVSL